MTPTEATASPLDLNLEWGPVEVLPDHPPILTAIRKEESVALAKISKGKRVLEIGSAHGYSAIIMALAGAESILSIDDHNGTTQLGDTFAIMLNNINTFGVWDRVAMMKGDSTRMLTHLINDEQQFDLIFVDGAADSHQLCLDIALSIVLLGHGTLAVHDYGHTNYPDKKEVLDIFFPEGPDELVTTLFVKRL